MRVTGNIHVYLYIHMGSSVGLFQSATVIMGTGTFRRFLMNPSIVWVISELG